MANRNGFSPPGVCDSFMIYADLLRSGQSNRVTVSYHQFN